MTEPNNPFNGLFTSAIATHEIFKSYVEVGFTREEALHLVSVILSSTIAKGPNTKPEE